MFPPKKFLAMGIGMMLIGVVINIALILGVVYGICLILQHFHII